MGKQLIADEKQSRMTPSEIMTIIIYFRCSHQRDFENFYKGYVSLFLRKDFPARLSYTRSLEKMPKAIIPMCRYFSILKGMSTGIVFVDSTNISVCHNLRIAKYKTFDGIAQRGKGTMGWFYGFKLHLVTNYRGEIVDTKLTTGNVHDTKPVSPCRFC